MSELLTDDEWRARDDLRKYWHAFCYCDVIPIDRDDFTGRLEKFGLVSGDLTIDDVLDAHAQFGRLDWHLVKKAMGPNWPAKWEALGPGEAIFDEEEDRT